MLNMTFKKCFLHFIIINLLVFSHVIKAELPDFTMLVEKHSAAVVNISTSQNTQSAFKQPGLNSEQGEVFDELMKHFLERNEEVPYSDKQSSSLGSGFIISADGYVVTNYHVISQADEVIVRLSDRRELEAKLIGVDKRSDVALLKIEGDELPVLDIGSTKDLKVGEWVVAIGSPFGFDHSVTAGIVSAKGRSLPSESYVPFIQTDVAINPGNSGGPLFNLRGEVVGINSQIFSRTGGFMGVSFAIPIDIAMNVAKQLQTKGKVSRGWLGVYIQEVTRDLAFSIGLSNPEGALIVGVIEGGPAQDILLKGDIVLAFDGENIDRASDLPVIVGSTALDEEIEITVRRDGETEVLKIVLSELPSDGSTEVVEKKNESKKNILLGMELIDLDEEAKVALDVTKGVLVQNVVGDPAKKSGIQVGDLIMMFKGQHISDLNELLLLGDDIIKDKTYPLLILRDGAAQFLALKAE